MSRGALAALLFSAVPVVAPTAALAQGPAASMTVPADFGSPVYPRQGRYLLVDAASAKLFMVEDGQVVDSMKVIVGKPEAQTPTISSKIYYATLNPYWNVPADLARKIIAPRVLQDGVSYLREHHYQVLASFDDGAPEISPNDVDWKAVAAGTEKVKIRQLPGPGNSMGQVKFGFPNSHSIFLHDTPKKELFASDERAVSNGCVRLEDAARLARWLLGQDPQMVSAGIPEQHVALPRAVPIYITYLNQQPTELALAGGLSTVAR
jgi:murein L,D-transpeptidase YcbB/YkuD